MKARLVSVLIASLFAGAAIAQPSATTKMPDKDSAVVTPAGAAQGRAPTALNTPQQGTAVKATPVPGSTTKEKEEKVVNTKSQQVQGDTSTAAKAGMEKPGSNSGKTMNKAQGMDKEKAAPAVVLTTPAPGPANTTPTTTQNGPGPARK